MFAEFAVQPELLATWPGYCSLIGHFGIKNGRMISRFPKRWKRDVIQAAQRTAADIEFIKITESLQNIDVMMVANGRPWDNQKDWLNNAIAEHARMPFHAVLSNQPSAGNDFVVDFPELDPANPPEAWAVMSSISVCRVACDMAGCIAAMLAQCSEVYFIDPYYDPNERRFNQPLNEFLRIIHSRSGSMDLPKIEYHTGNRNKDLATIQANLEKWIAPSLATGHELKLVRWEQEEIHNRYILTDLGAVMFGNGLDENLNNPVDKETVSIIGEATRLERLEDYSPTSKRFTWLGETLSIVGK